MSDDGDLFDGFDELDPEKALRHLGEVPLVKYQGTLLTMLQAVRLGLKQKQVAEDEIERLAPGLVMHLCDALGGGVGYIPRGEVVKRALRDERLFADWRGTSEVRGLTPPKLSRKYRLAVQTVYEVIARQKALHARHEPDMFGFSEDGGKG